MIHRLLSLYYQSNPRPITALINNMSQCVYMSWCVYASCQRCIVRRLVKLSMDFLENYTSFYSLPFKGLHDCFFIYIVTGALSATFLKMYLPQWSSFHFHSDPTEIWSTFLWIFSSVSQLSDWKSRHCWGNSLAGVWGQTIILTGIDWYMEYYPCQKRFSGHRFICVRLICLFSFCLTRNTKRDQ